MAGVVTSLVTRGSSRGSIALEDVKPIKAFMKNFAPEVDLPTPMLLKKHAWPEPVKPSHQSTLRSLSESDELEFSPKAIKSEPQSLLDDLVEKTANFAEKAHLIKLKAEKIEEPAKAFEVYKVALSFAEKAVQREHVLTLSALTVCSEIVAPFEVTEALKTDLAQICEKLEKQLYPEFTEGI